MGILGVTFVVLLILQLLGVIAVSWWVVFAPLLLIPVAWLAILAFVFVVGWGSERR